MDHGVYVCVVLCISGIFKESRPVLATDVAVQL